MVWVWGTFRDSSGPIGLVAWAQLEKEPVQLKLEGLRAGDSVVKVKIFVKNKNINHTKKYL